MKYKTQGTCSQEIEIELKDGVIDSVNFTGGCNGNLKGIGSRKGNEAGGCNCQM